MALFYLLAFVILFYGAKYQKQGYYSDNLGKDQSNAIKGLFILMVFISHSMSKVRSAGFEFGSGVDAFGDRIQTEFGQLIVVMFLFYSGYGVMESYVNKGQDYLKTFPKKRILTTLLNFDIAVLLFAVLDLALGIEIGLKQFGLSLLGWKDVGNDNWYIFVILFCYAVAYMGFRIYLLKSRPGGMIPCCASLQVCGSRFIRTSLQAFSKSVILSFFWPHLLHSSCYIL